MSKRVKPKLRLTSIILWLFLAILGAAILWGSLLALTYKYSHRNQPLRLGVSFSQKYAQELGLDWQAAYTAMLTELKVKNLRLMSYWDIHEPTPGQYDFASLDRQMALAADNQARVSLAIGLKQPRWPECHQPDWAQQLNPTEQRVALLKYLETVAKRYQDHPALASWQLENEVSNQSFGECPQFDRKFLANEYELVKSLDQQHPVIINVGNQTGVPLRGPVGDKVGLSLYRSVYTNLGSGFYWNYPLRPAGWYSWRAKLIEALHGKSVFIHELQTEPWGPKPTAQLSIEEQNHSMDAEKVRASVEYARSSGIPEIYLWGSEWWFWRKVNFGDDSLWQTAQQIFIQSQR